MLRLWCRIHVRARTARRVNRTSMRWSISAEGGEQKIYPGKETVTQRMSEWTGEVKTKVTPLRQEKDKRRLKVRKLSALTIAPLCRACQVLLIFSTLDLIFKHGPNLRLSLVRMGPVQCFRILWLTLTLSAQLAGSFPQVRTSEFRSDV